MPVTGTNRIDVDILFEKQSDAEVAFGDMTAQIDGGLAEFGDSITITRDKSGDVSVSGTMRFASKATRDTLTDAMVTAAEKAKGHIISTHLCKHIIGESCPKSTIIKGGDLSAIG